MTVKIKECPFCGNDNPTIIKGNVQFGYGSGGIFMKIVCPSCECQTKEIDNYESITEQEMENKIINVWNTRI